jgi:hypothetical protein
MRNVRGVRGYCSSQHILVQHLESYSVVLECSVLVGRK